MTTYYKENKSSYSNIMGKYQVYSLLGKLHLQNSSVQVRLTSKTVKHVIGELCENYHHGDLWSPH